MIFCTPSLDAPCRELSIRIHIQIRRSPLGLTANCFCVSAQDVQSSCRNLFRNLCFRQISMYVHPPFLQFDLRHRQLTCQTEPLIENHHLLLPSMPSIRQSKHLFSTYIAYFVLEVNHDVQESHDLVELAFVHFLFLAKF